MLCRRLLTAAILVALVAGMCIACPLYIKDGKAQEATVHFETIGDAYKIVRVEVTKDGKTECALIAPPLPFGIYPWAGLETPPVAHEKTAMWIALHAGKPCPNDSYQILTQ